MISGGLVILDASAVIALICQEKGAQKVQAALANGAISAVNLSEVATFLVKQGADPDETANSLQELLINVVPFDAQHAFIAASLIPYTQPYGLSLADRACLALARSSGASILTADRMWKKLNIGLTIEVIR